MRRPKEGEFHPYYSNYIDQVEGVDFISAIEKSTEELSQWLQRVSLERENFAYAEGKWTIKQMLRHIIDCDLVFIYRAISIARKDKTSLPGFEQNDWADAATAENLVLVDLIEELKTIRKFIIMNLSKLPVEDLERIGNANGSPASALSIAFIIAGHSNHHLKILKERY